jgi:hypothetical protein
MALRWLLGEALSRANSQAPPVRTNDDFVIVSTEELGEGDDFEEIENHPAYSKPLQMLSYAKADPGLRNSSHRVVKGKEGTGEQFIKFYDKEEKLYAESFLSHLYSLSLLYGVARTYVRYNEKAEPVALSSQAIDGFHTFIEKDCTLTAGQLADPLFRQRFTRIMAVWFRMHEDDGHRNNLTTQLQLFDAGCAFWDVTYKIFGGRPNVDNTLLIGRIPEVAFKLHEDDVLHAPKYTHAQPWYCPSLDAVATSYVSSNPFTPEETSRVRDLEENPETLQIYFMEPLDWMLDLTTRFLPVANLNIPKNCRWNSENLIEMYSNKDKEIDRENWAILPKMPQFQEFLRNSWESAIHEILVRGEIRNLRFAYEKKLFPKFDKQFDDAMLGLETVIQKFNELIEVVNQAIQAAETQKVLMFSFKRESLFFHDRSPGIPKIDCTAANKMISKARLVAEEMIKLEQEIGTEKWEPFVHHREMAERLGKEASDGVERARNYRCHQA